MDFTVWIGPVIIAAIVSQLFGLWRERTQLTQQRAERVRDVQRAIYAEIRAYLNVLKRDDLDAYEHVLVARMQSDPTFIPMIPTEANDIVFKAIVADIHVLPRSSVDPVVVYYSQLASIHAMIADLRSAAYRKMSVERRIAMYQDYMSLKREAIELGDHALEMITAYAEGGPEGIKQKADDEATAAIARSKAEVQTWLSSQGADRSDH